MALTRKLKTRSPMLVMRALPAFPLPRAAGWKDRALRGRLDRISIGPPADHLGRAPGQVRTGSRHAIGSAVVDLIFSMAKREVTFFSGTEAISRL